MNTQNQTRTTNPASDCLYRIAEETFENLAFMLSMPEDQEPKATVHIGFTGPNNGVLTITVSAAMLPQLAANMMGIPDGDEPTPEQQTDALKELGNIICGNILPVLAGATAEFSIAPPEIITDDKPAPEAITTPQLASTHIKLDTGNAELTLYMEPPATGD